MECDLPEDEDPYDGEQAGGNFLSCHQKYYMTTGTYTSIWDLVWKIMNKQFTAAEIKRKIEALPPFTPDSGLGMKHRHCVPGELRWVTNTLVESVTSVDYVGSTDTECHE